jgi:hypothetical protein
MATVRTSYNPAEYNRLSWRHFDVWLLLIVLALLTIGLLMIGSATQNSVDPDLANAARRQGLYALIGVIVLILTAAIDYRVWYNARHVRCSLRNWLKCCWCWRWPVFWLTAPIRSVACAPPYCR